MAESHSSPPPPFFLSRCRRSPKLALNHDAKDGPNCKPPAPSSELGRWAWASAPAVCGVGMDPTTGAAGELQPGPSSSFCSCNFSHFLMPEPLTLIPGIGPHFPSLERVGWAADKLGPALSLWSLWRPSGWAAPHHRHHRVRGRELRCVCVSWTPQGRF